MSPTRRPFTAMPFWRRVTFGAAIGVGGLSWAVLLLVVITLSDGRYQRFGAAGATEWDMWVLCATYPLGLAAAGAVAGALAAWARRLWQAALVGFAAALPAMVLISLAADRRARGGPHVDWGASLAVAALLGGGVGVVVFRRRAAPSAGSAGGEASAPGV